MSLESKSKTTVEVVTDSKFGELMSCVRWIPLEDAQKNTQKLDEAWFIKYNILKEKIVEANKILDEIKNMGCYECVMRLREALR